VTNVSDFVRDKVSEVELDIGDLVRDPVGDPKVLVGSGPVRSGPVRSGCSSGIWP